MTLGVGRSLRAVAAVAAVEAMHPVRHAGLLAVGASAVASRGSC